MTIRLPLLTGLAVLAVTSALKIGPVRLPHNKRFISYNKGPSPENSLLECVYELEGDEKVDTISWKLFEDNFPVGGSEWKDVGVESSSGRLTDMARIEGDGSLYLTKISYDFAGEYSCSVKLTDGKTKETDKWEVLIIDYPLDQSYLKSSILSCRYSSSFTTGPMYPEAEVRAGLYSESFGGFYQEMPEYMWLIERHPNKSITYSYSDFSLELNSQTPEDAYFYVTVGVMKSDGNFVPITAKFDRNIMAKEMGCPEPRLEAYQQIHYHKDNITCRKEHRNTEATVTCKEGFRADGDVQAVNITCNDATRIWILDNGKPARRQDLECVISASTTMQISTSLLCTALVLFLKLIHL